MIAFLVLNYTASPACTEHSSQKCEPARKGTARELHVDRTLCVATPAPEDHWRLAKGLGSGRKQLKPPRFLAYAGRPLRTIFDLTIAQARAFVNPLNETKLA